MFHFTEKIDVHVSEHTCTHTGARPKVPVEKQGDKCIVDSKLQVGPISDF